MAKGKGAPVNPIKGGKKDTPIAVKGFGKKKK